MSLLCETLTKFKEDNDYDINNEIMMDKALMTLYPDIFVTSDKARDILDNATNTKQLKNDADNYQSLPINSLQSKLSTTFKEVIRNTKNCFSIKKPV